MWQLGDNVIYGSSDTAIDKPRKVDFTQPTNTYPHPQAAGFNWTAGYFTTSTNAVPPGFSNAPGNRLADDQGNLIDGGVGDDFIAAGTGADTVHGGAANDYTYNLDRRAAWNHGHSLMKAFGTIGLILTLGTSMSANAGFLGFGGTSWKEEVLLHDGGKIIVARSVERGGRHEIGQEPPYKWQKLKLTMPVTGEHVTWEDDFSADIGAASFLPMLFDVHQGSAYIVANTMGCPSYNKWGRPNPPYVVFRYQDKKWKRITLQELPAEIKTPNLIQSMPDATAKRVRENPVSAKSIQEINAGFRQPEYRTILREALKEIDCPIPSTSAAKLITPIIDGRPLYYNWWPLAKDWLDKTYGKNK